MPSPLDPSAAYVLGRVAALEAQLVALVDGAPVTDEPAALVAAAEQRADQAQAAGERVRLREVQRVFGLSGLQVTALLAAAAPDLDARFGDLYAALADDPLVRHATAELVLRLADVPAWDAAARADLGDDGALLVEGLAERRGGGPLLRRPWTVPATVLDALLGGTEPDPSLVDVLVEVPPVPGEAADRLRRAFDAGARLTYLRERPGGLAPSRAVAALAPAMAEPMVLDLSVVLPGDDATELVRTALRDAQLSARGLVVGPVDDVEQVVPALRLLARSGWPVVVHGARPWDPGWTSRVPVEVDVTGQGADSREQVWHQALDGRGVRDAAGLAARLAHLRLGSVQVVRAVAAAALDAAAAGDAEVTYDALVRGAQRQNGSGLERLARRIRPQASPADLVLPDEPRRLLAEIVDRVRHRDALRAYGVGGRASTRRGVTALFGGPPGTGKTLAVEVLAHELGVDVYAVDLSTVVDKYIGETEKNLERIFTQATGVNGVLFFDEADALFGRRGQVSEAKDRHANLGVAFLLQRLEDFDGLAVLATNLRSNLDEAFARRLDVIIDFPTPDAAARRALFDAGLGPLVPRDPDLDLDALTRFELSGGDIRNVAVTAVTATAAAGRPVTTLDLVRAVHQEYRKMGRLAATAEFRPWAEQLAVPPSGTSR